jgi:hypothetical protein
LLNGNNSPSLNDSAIEVAKSTEGEFAKCLANSLDNDSYNLFNSASPNLEIEFTHGFAAC